MKGSSTVFPGTTAKGQFSKKSLLVTEMAKIWKKKKNSLNLLQHKFESLFSTNGEAKSILRILVVQAKPCMMS